MQLISLLKRTFNVRLFLFFTALLSLNFLNAKSSDATIGKRADFILDVAYNIYYDEPTSKKNYLIGIYGRDSDAKALYSILIEKTENLYIDKKPIVVKLFKFVRSVEPVDVIYISGGTKIRLSDLNAKLSKTHYSLITENYPFGMSAINLAFDTEDQLIFELQDVALRKNGASLRNKITQNRQRVTSASQWSKKVYGKKKSRHYYVNNSDSDTSDEIINDSITVDTVIIEKMIESSIPPKEQQKYLSKIKSLKKSNTRLKWFAGFLFLTLGAMGFYIFKLKKG